MEAIINILAEHLNSAVFMLLIIMLVALWGVYKITQISTKWKLKESDVAQLKQNWDREIPYIKTRVDLIFQKTYPNATAIATSSPSQLTDVGRKIADAIGAESLVATKKDLIKLVERKSPQNAYDLQRICFSVVEQHLERMMAPEQVKIAKDESLKYGIPLDNALSVVAILLRDKLMREKGWVASDIDKHDQNFQ